MKENTKGKDIQAMLRSHPCYNESAHHNFARMHLPVAPKCNIQCNYCNRKYDCANESRPGVTSEILSPELAVEKVRHVKEKIPYLSVLGIAGPGDPLANEETFRTLELLEKEFPDLTLCLSTNGLNLSSNVKRLARYGVKFVTVTVNAIDPAVGAKIYDRVHFEGRTLYGEEAARVLIENQLKGIEEAAHAGMLVKVNSVLVPGINSDHLPEVARKVKELGAHIVNILPLIPVPGTRFENVPAPTSRERKELQDLCGVDIKQMRHCRQCRADAIGLLGEDRSAEFAHFSCQLSVSDDDSLTVKKPEGKDLYRIAVATSNGIEVDQHFGHAEVFHTYVIEEGNVSEGRSIGVIEEQEIPMFGPGHRTKIESTVDKLKDMDAVVSTMFGLPALELLRENNIVPITGKGDIRASLHVATDSIQQERSNASIQAPVIERGKTENLVDQVIEITERPERSWRTKR